MADEEKNKGGAPEGNKNAEGCETSGRPKIQLSVFWDTWKEDIIALYEAGASDIEVKALIHNKTDGEVKCSNGLWNRLIDEEVEFSQTIKKGKMLSEAWWEEQGRTNLKESKFNPTLWYMNMKNRFGWRDKQEVTGPNGGPITFTKIERVIVDPDEQDPSD